MNEAEAVIQAINAPNTSRKTSCLIIMEEEIRKNSGGGGKKIILSNLKTDFFLLCIYKCENS